MFLVLPLVLLVNCTGSKEETEDPIIVGYLPIIAHLPAFVADAEKLLEEIPVEFRVFPTSNDMMAALAGGQIDIATTISSAAYFDFAFATLAEGKQPPALLFSVSQTGASEPFDGVFAASQSTISSLAELSGKRVGVFPGSTAMKMLSYVLERDYDVNEEDVTWVMLPPSAQLNALVSGDIDALFAYETVRTSAEVAGYRQLHGSVIATALEGAPYGASAVNRDFFSRRSESALAFMAAFDEGIEIVQSRPNYAREILQQRLGITQEVASICNLERRITSTQIRDDQTISLITSFIEILKQAGVLTSVPAWSLDDILIPERY